MPDYLPPNAVCADPLSEALEDLGLRCWEPGPFEFSAPWGIRIAGELGWCHLLLEGRGYLQIEGREQPIEMGPGDLAITLQGTGHCLANDPDSRKDVVEGLLWPRHFEARAPLQHGGGGACTRIASICFAFDDSRRAPLLELLPGYLLVRGRNSQPAIYVEHIFDLIEQEAGTRQPCTQTIIARLVRILLIRSIYAHASGPPAEGQPWLKALIDPAIGPALALMHKRPEVPWTVASLADEAAMSRTAFAVKFAKMLGRSPLEYLTEWRMQRAAVLLTKSQSGLKEIASRVGYDSAAAFSRAFARWAGIAPGAYRDRMRTAAPANRCPPILA